MKILIIEDERLLADSLKSLLKGKGFDVEAVYDGETGAEYAELGIYDLLILDVMMPGLDGYQVARQVRSRRCATPILMLTAKSGLEDRIEGLNAGADYYLTKPFDTRELLACINALLRRQGNQGAEMSYGNTLLDLSSSMLVCGEKRVRLSAREFDVMRFLMQSKERNLSKEVILSRVWASIPTRWRIMWRSMWAFCGRSWPASAPISALRPSAAWATIWRWTKLAEKAADQIHLHQYADRHGDAGHHFRTGPSFYR